MKKILSLISIFAIVGASLELSAQHTSSGYFIDNYTYRYQMNPAMDNEDNFVSLPVLGNFDVTAQGTIGLENLLYNVNGQTTTFMNPNVSASEFLGGLNDRNILGADLKLGVISAGFKGFGGYNTISVNARFNVETNIPKTLFSFLKEGVSNKSYDISDVGAHADAYMELSLGHSRKINDQLRVGGALKFLLGAGNVDAEFNEAKIVLREDYWTAVTDARIQSSIKGLSYTHGYNETTGHEYVDGMEIDGPGLNGFGMAVDLGAVYNPLPDWKFSLALLDFGFMNWNNNIEASTNGRKIVNTDSYSFNIDEDAENSFENELDIIKDDLSALYELEDNGNIGSRTKMLTATLNVGVEYTLPVYRKLKFGLLNSTRFQAPYTWTEFRLSANVAPVKAFSAGANVAVGTYGFSFGWLLNVKVPGFNMFLGMDHTPTRLAKQGIPLSSNASVNLGINFPF